MQHSDLDMDYRKKQMHQYLKLSLFPQSKSHNYLVIIQVSPSLMSTNTAHLSLLASSHMVCEAATLPGEEKW